LQEALLHVTVDSIDFVIVEGFKAAPIPKIEVHRPALGKPLIAVNDENVIAIATDEPEKIDTSLPLLELNAPQKIAQFIEQFIAKQRA